MVITRLDTFPIFPSPLASHIGNHLIGRTRLFCHELARESVTAEEYQQIIGGISTLAHSPVLTPMFLRHGSHELLAKMLDRISRGKDAWLDRVQAWEVAYKFH